MARPCKAIETKSGAISKANKELREEAEKSIKGNNDEVKKCPKWLTKSQKAIRKKLVFELKNVLTNVDCYILDECAVAIDRVIEIEKMINENLTLLENKTLISTREKYTATFFRCCSELSMSPQSRAKIANAIVSGRQEENPLMRILSDDD